MSEYTILVEKQNNEMYKLGRKHGALSILYKILIKINNEEDKSPFPLEICEASKIIEKEIEELKKEREEEE